MATSEHAPLTAPPWVRPSSWIIAAGVALGGAFGSLGGKMADGEVAGFEWGQVVVDGGWWFGISLAVIFGLPLVLWFGYEIADFIDRWRVPYSNGDSGEPPTSDNPPLVSPLVTGGLVDELERHHMEGLLLTLRHAQAAGTLKSGALVPSAFVDNKHWQFWTDLLAASNLADKQNGVTTVLPRGRTWSWAKRQVLNGLFESPEQDADAPLPRHPLPFDAAKYYKAELEKG